MQDGFYWYTQRGKDRTVVRVETSTDPTEDAGPWVYFPGEDGETHIEELCGSFTGPLQPPT